MIGRYGNIPEEIFLQISTFSQKVVAIQQTLNWLLEKMFSELFPHSFQFAPLVLIAPLKTWETVLTWPSLARIQWKKLKQSNKNLFNILTMESVLPLFEWNYKTQKFKWNLSFKVWDQIEVRGSFSYQIRGLISTVRFIRRKYLILGGVTAVPLKWRISDSK